MDYSLPSEPDHPILQNAHSYRVARIFLCLDSENSKRSYIELMLQRDGERDHLRFLSPTCIEMNPEVAPVAFGGRIVDVSARQWDHVRIAFDAIEDDELPPIRFFAQDVIRITKRNEI